MAETILRVYHNSMKAFVCSMSLRQKKASLSKFAKRGKGGIILEFTRGCAYKAS